MNQPATWHDHAKNRPIAETNNGAEITRRQGRSELFVCDDRCQALDDLQPFGFGHRSRIDEHEVTLDQKVKEFPPACEVLFLLLDTARHPTQIPPDVAGGNLPQ